MLVLRMDIQSYLLKSATSQSCFARLIGVRPAVLYQWIKGIRPIPIARCLAIEEATKGEVSRRDLRPRDWQDIWPDIATPKRAPVSTISLQM
ncbi:MAG: YdaS family helix-turn-helix protein [Pseudomonadota bacterium]